MLARFSLRFKITFLVVMVVALASAALGHLAQTNLTRLLTQSAGVGSLTASGSLARMLDQSVFTRENITEQERNQLIEKLEPLVLQGTLTHVRLLRVDHVAQRATSIVSLPLTGDPDYFQPDTSIPFSESPIFAQVSPGHEAVQMTGPGFFMMGWSPISKDGKVVGLVLAASDVTEINATLKVIISALASTMLLLVALSGIVVYKFASTFEKTAVTDGLMGIYNHKYFKQRLEEEVAKSRRYGQTTSMVLCDIDFFKRVNDTYGHATGDLVLKKMAKWVTDTARTTDVVCRYGGEEISIILPHTGVAGAQEFGERLRQKIAEQVIHDPDEKVTFRVTVSVGVAQWEQGITFMDLIKRADAALYHSKHNGRNRVTLYQDEILAPPADN